VVDKSKVIKLFENLLNENLNSKMELEQVIYPSTSTQYKQRI